MFKNRSFNLLVGLVIAVLAVLSIGTAMYSQQVVSSTADNRFAPLDRHLNHEQAVPNSDENTSNSVVNIAPARSVTSDYAALKDRQLSQMDPAPANRVSSSAYVALKDHALNRLDGTSTQVARVNLPSAERYASIKASQLEQAEAMTAANKIGIAVTGSVKPTNAERYANLKDAQLARLNLGETISAGRARYMNLKGA